MNSKTLLNECELCGDETGEILFVDREDPKPGNNTYQVCELCWLKDAKEINEHDLSDEHWEREIKEAEQAKAERVEERKQWFVDLAVRNFYREKITKLFAHQDVAIGMMRNSRTTGPLLAGESDNMIAAAQVRLFFASLSSLERVGLFNPQQAQAIREVSDRFKAERAQRKEDD